MPTPQKLIQNIVSDMKVELSEMFDRNFEEKGFFGQPWKPRANKRKYQKGTLMVVTANLRRSIRGIKHATGVQFTSAMPYAAIHNEGGKYTAHVKAHNRTSRKGNKYAVKAHNRQVSMPKRQFVGAHNKVNTAIEEIAVRNTNDFFNELAKEIKQ